MKGNHIRDRRLVLATICALTLCCQPSNAEYDSDILLFPFIEHSFLLGLPSDSPLDSTENNFGVDLFATLQSGRFVFLGEALITDHEQEIERLQLGWRMGDSKAWLGRFHNPIGYWNTQYHHGSFLETSVSRPAIVEFEDDGGILPMHLTGLLVEGLNEIEEHGIGYAIAIALGPELNDTLEANDILRPTSGSHGLALTVNLYRQPKVYGPNQYGLFANYTEMPATDRGLDEIQQIVAGTYWNWESDPWRIIGSAFYVRSQLHQGAGTESGDFFDIYLQAERRLSDSWTVFGRVEKAFGDDDAPYLDLFPDRPQERVIGGINLNLQQRHALKLELSSHLERNERIRALALQWAAMF